MRTEPGVGGESGRLGVDRTTLTRWLIGVTRPVLGPLAASTLLRAVDQFTGLALFAIAVAGVLSGWPLPALIGWLVGLSLLKASARYGEQFLGHLVAFRALELLRTEVFSRLWPQAPAVVARSRSGDLLERTTKDVDRVEVFFAHTLAPAITAVFVPIAAVIGIAVAVDPRLALVAGAGLGVTLVVVPVCGAQASGRVARATASGRGRLTQSVTDSIQGRVEVTGYGLQPARLGEADAIAGDLERQARLGARIASGRRGLSLAAMLAAVLVVVTWGAALGVGTAVLAVVVVVVLRCFAITAGVEAFLTSLDVSFASAHRLYTLTHRPPKVCDPACPRAIPGGPLGLVWTDVTYAYPGQGAVPALSRVSAVAPPGQRTCVVGASGSGKSTLVQLALRYDDPDSGSVTLTPADVSLPEVSLAELRGAITYVSQRPFLLAASVADNLRLVRPDATDADLRRVCEQARIHEAVVAMPAGYDTPVGEWARRVSGGQRARLALARALLTGARVFVLDEYTAHLDADLADEVAASVRSARPDATIVEITHRVSRSLNADHVIVLEQGRCVEAGAPSELSARAGSYSTLLARDGVHR